MMLLEESEVAAERFDQELALHVKFLSWVGQSSVNSPSIGHAPPEALVR
jgi:hypothetical protein